ncbi:MAG: right-handed parallel beta-helix repeat-containing protein [Armatimonadetes bacterium]|nr:right-handed parallel beta-helix repeat-containing protein [Armatimonadota bacterium]MDE2206668.1 right-handed parallel beta-helix repeat-containing protein [Armatimonadota bacterium]
MYPLLRSTNLSLLAATGILASAHVLNAQATGAKRLTDGVKITSTSRIAPGDYRLHDPGSGAVQISGSNITVDFRGAVIRGDGKGIGIHVHDARNVQILNATVTGCQFGIVLDRCVAVRVVHCHTSRNGNLPAGTVIDESGNQPEDNHGAGLQLRDSTGCIVDACTSQHQWDGVDVVRCMHNTIQNSHFSFNGNWGVHFWDSSENTFQHNSAIWCTTGAGELFQALTGWQTYDAQGVGIDHNSCRNRILDNDLRFGGDGIFVRANEGPITPGTVVPPKDGSHGNILIGNDCSYSPNNAIEVDLVDDTVIRDNNCSNSNYGMWLGYSRHCDVAGNLCINDSTHAVEIEDGQFDHFSHNIFGWDAPRPTSSLIYLRQNGRDPTPSRGYVLTGNTFYGAGIPVQLHNTQASATGNTAIGADAAPAAILVADAGSTPAESGSRLSAAAAATSAATQVKAPARLVPGWNVLRGASARDTFAEVAGVPVMLHSLPGKSAQRGFLLPRGFWYQPVPSRAVVRVFSSTGFVSAGEPEVRWPAARLRVTALAPNPAALGERLTVQFSGARAGIPVEAWLNGKPTPVLHQGPHSLQLGQPAGLLISSRYNLILGQRGAPSSAPVPLTVTVAPAQSPHLLTATFSPTSLHAGDLLKVTFTVRNNLPGPASLITQPTAGFTYTEKQAYWDIGAAEVNGALDLRVTSDHPGANDPGSWPWMFGFSRPTLGPGEVTTVTGFIRVETPGDHIFRVGLVAGGARFIDDNAFQTHIQVLP